ncbi:MAG: ankyrin repeat domain-containing protein [Terriglobales bacterium]
MATGADLIAAIKANDIAQAKQLLTADPAIAGARDENGVSAVMNARYRGQTEVVERLRACGVTLDIFEAATLGDRARLEQLLSDPAQVHGRSPDGFTPLHLACFFGQEASAQLLLERGADPGSVARNPMQVQPLHSAVAGRQLGIVRLLLERGAAVNARQQMGWTALHEAANQGNREMAEALLRHGADPTLGNDEGKTPADVATGRGHTDLARLFDGGQPARTAG